jgi:hypothetical protein
MNSNYYIAHHYYTASKKYGGFNTFFATNNLESNEVTELESNCNYYPPIKLSLNIITELDIKELPIANIYSDLTGTDKKVLRNIVYTGTSNHTPDRHGNFLSHSVVFSDNLCKIRLPVLFNNIEFRKTLSIEEEKTFKNDSTELQILNYKNKEKEQIKESLSFILENEKYKLVFYEILDILIDGWLNEKGKNITICSNKDEVKNFIFSIYSILPSFLINQYSFATYVHNPEKYSYQFTGIVPECDISNLNQEYFKMLNLDNNKENYQIKHEFTRYFDNILKNDDTSTIIKLLSELEQSLIDLKFDEISLKLNDAIEIIRFKNNIYNSELNELIKVLKFIEIQDVKKNLIDFVRSHKPELYFAYIISEFNNNYVQTNEHSVKAKLFEEYYDNYFKNDTDFRKQFFYDFFTEYKKLLAIEDQFKASLNLLLNQNFKNALETQNILNELRFVDSNFTKLGFEEELEQITLLYEKSINETMPNLYRIIITRNLNNDISKNKFLEKFSNYEDLIKTMSQEQKNEIYQKTVNNPALLTNFSDSNKQAFNSLLGIVTETINDEQTQSLATEIMLNFDATILLADQRFKAFLKLIDKLYPAMNNDIYNEIIAKYSENITKDYEKLYALLLSKKLKEDIENYQILIKVDFYAEYIRSFNNEVKVEIFNKVVETLKQERIKPDDNIKRGLEDFLKLYRNCIALAEFNKLIEKFLLEVNAKIFIDNEYLNTILEIIDSNYTELNENTELSLKLLEKYNDNIKKDHANLHRLKLLNELNSDVSENKFFEKIEKYESLLNNMKEDDKVKLFSNALLSIRIPEDYSIDFNAHLDIIERNFDNSTEFFNKFFKEECKSKRDLCSIIKTYFVIAVIKSEQYDDLLKKIKYNKKEKKKIFDYFKSKEDSNSAEIFGKLLKEKSIGYKFKKIFKFKKNSE